MTVKNVSFPSLRLLCQWAALWSVCKTLPRFLSHLTHIELVVGGLLSAVYSGRAAWSKTVCQDSGLTTKPLLGNSQENTKGDLCEKLTQQKQLNWYKGTRKQTEGGYHQSHSSNRQWKLSIQPDLSLQDGEKKFFFLPCLATLPSPSCSDSQKLKRGNRTFNMNSRKINLQVHCGRRCGIACIHRDKRSCYVGRENAKKKII